MINILMVQRIFSFYRKAIFDKLNNTYTFKLIHTKNSSGIEQVHAPYSQTVPAFKYYKNETNLLIGGFKNMLKFKPNVIIHELSPGIFTIFIWLLYAKITGAKFIVWGQGCKIQAQNNLTTYKNRLKLLIMKQSDAVILYAKHGKEIFSKLIKPEKIFVAQNTIDSELAIKRRTHLDKKGKQAILKEIGWHADFNLIFIGRLTQRKHPEILLEIMKQLHKNLTGTTISMHIIGDGELLANLKDRARQKGLNNIKFYGKIYDNLIKSKYLYAADLFVMPGAMGLSVNEAFAYGCPVLTFTPQSLNIAHGPEVTSIKQHQTGFFVNSASMASKQIIDFISDRNLQKEMRYNSLTYFDNQLNIDLMLSGFNEAIKYVHNA